MTDLGPLRGVCAWCGLELYGDSDPPERIRTHQMECPSHPMREVERQRDEMLAELEELARIFAEGLFVTIKAESEKAQRIIAIVKRAKGE